MKIDCINRYAMITVCSPFFFYYFIRPTWLHCLLLTCMYICSTCSFQTFFFNQLCRSCHALCLQTIGVSLLLPVVKGKQSQLPLFLPSRTVTIPPGSLPKKVSRAQRMWNTLPQGCLTDLCQAFTFSIYCCLHGGSDCMLRAWGWFTTQLHLWVTCGGDSYSH